MPTLLILRLGGAFQDLGYKAMFSSPLFRKKKKNLTIKEAPVHTTKGLKTTERSGVDRSQSLSPCPILNETWPKKIESKSKTDTLPTNTVLCR